LLTFFITQKSLDSHAKASVTSPLLRVIKFYAVGTLGRKYGTNVENVTRQ